MYAIEFNHTNSVYQPKHHTEEKKNKNVNGKQLTLTFSYIRGAINTIHMQHSTPIHFEINKILNCLQLIIGVNALIFNKL